MPPRTDQRTLIRRWLTRNPFISIALFGGLVAFVLLSAFAISKGCSGSGKNKLQQQTLQQSIFQSQKSFHGQPAAKNKYQHPNSFKPQPKHQSTKSQAGIPPQNEDLFIQAIRDQKLEDKAAFDKALGKNTSKIYLAIEGCWDDTDSKNDKVTGKVLELLLEKASSNPYLYSKLLKKKIWEGKKTWDRITTELMCLKPSQSNLIGKLMKEAFVLETKYSAQYEARDTVIPTIIKEMGSAFKAGTIGHDFVRQLFNQYAKDDYDRKQMFEKIDEAFSSADEVLLLDDLYDFVNFKDFSYDYSKMSLAFFRGLIKRLGNKLNSHQKELVRLINKSSLSNDRGIDLYLLFAPYIIDKQLQKEIEPLKAKAELKNKADKEAKHLQNILNIEHLKKLPKKELAECRLQSLKGFIVQGKDDEICEFLELLFRGKLFVLSEIPKDIDFAKLPKVKRLLFDKYLVDHGAFLTHFAGKDQVLTEFLAECTDVMDWTNEILVVGISKATLLEIDAKNAYSATLTLTEPKASSLFSIAITNELPNLMLFLDKLLNLGAIQALQADEKQKLIQITVKLCKTDVLLNKYMKLIAPIVTLIDLKDISFADKPISTATLIDSFCKNSDDLKDFLGKFASQAALIEKAIEKVPLPDYTDFILTANLSIESAKSIDTKAKYTKATTLKATEPLFILLLEAAFEKELLNLQAALKNEIISVNIKDVKSPKLLSALVKMPEYAAIFTGLDAKTFEEKLKIAPTFLDDASEECLAEFGQTLLQEFAKDSQKANEFSALLEKLKNLSSETIVAICAGFHEPIELLDAITGSKLNDIESKPCKPIILNALATNKKAKTFFVLLKKKDWGTVEWFVGNLNSNLVQQYRVDLVELFFIWFTDLNDDQLRTFVDLLPDFARFASSIKGMKAFTANFVEDLLTKEAIFTDRLLKMFLSLFSDYQEPKSFIPLMIKLASKNYIHSAGQLWEKIFSGEDYPSLYDELISHADFRADVQLFKDKLSDDFIKSTFKKLNQATCERLEDLYGKEFYLSCLHATFTSVQAPEMVFKLSEMPADLITFMSLSRDLSDLEKLLKVKSIKAVLDQIWFSDVGIVTHFSDKAKLLGLIRENLKKADSDTFFRHCHRGMSIVGNTTFVKAFCPPNGNVFGRELPKFLDFISKFDMKDAHLDAFAEEFIKNHHYLADYQTIGTFFVANGNNLYFQKLMPYTKKMNDACFAQNAFVTWIFQTASKALSGTCKEHFMTLMQQIKASIERKESAGTYFYLEYCQGSFASGDPDLFAALCPVSPKMKESFGETTFLTFLYKIVASFAAAPDKFPHVNVILNAFTQHKEKYEGDYIKNCKEGFKYNNEIFSKMCPVVTTQDFINKASHVQMIKEFLPKYGPERPHLKAILETVKQQIVSGRVGSYIMEYFELGSSQSSNEPISFLCPWTAKLASEKGTDSFRRPFKAILSAYAKAPDSFPHAIELLERASEAITGDKMHQSDFIALAQMGLDLDSNEILSKLAPAAAIEAFYKSESSFVTWFIQNINLLSKYEHSTAIAQVFQGEIQKGKLNDFYVKMCTDCSESALFAILNPTGPHFAPYLNNSEFKSWLPKKLALITQQTKDLSANLTQALIHNNDADIALHYCKLGAATKDNHIFASLCPIENNPAIESKWKTNNFIDWFLVLLKDANLDHLKAMSLEFKRQFLAGNLNYFFDRIFPLAVDLKEEFFANVFPVDEARGMLKQFFSSSALRNIFIKQLDQLKSAENRTFKKCFQLFVDSQIITNEISNDNYLTICQFGYQVSNEIFQLTCPAVYEYQKNVQFTNWFAVVLAENADKAYDHTLTLAKVYTAPFVKDQLKATQASLLGAAAIAGESNELLKVVFPAKQPEYFMNDSSWRNVLFGHLVKMNEFSHLIEIMGNVSDRLKSDNVISFAVESCEKSALTRNNQVFATLCPVSTSLKQELSKGEFMRWVIGLSDDFEHKKGLVSELESKIIASSYTKQTFCALEIVDHPLSKKYCLKK